MDNELESPTISAFADDTNLIKETASDLDPNYNNYDQIIQEAQQIEIPQNTKLEMKRASLGDKLKDKKKKTEFSGYMLSVVRQYIIFISCCAHIVSMIKMWITLFRMVRFRLLMNLPGVFSLVAVTVMGCIRQLKLKKMYILKGKIKPWQPLQFRIISECMIDWPE